MLQSSSQNKSNNKLAATCAMSRPQTVPRRTMDKLRAAAAAAEAAATESEAEAAADSLQLYYEFIYLSSNHRQSSIEMVVVVVVAVLGSQRSSYIMATARQRAAVAIPSCHCVLQLAQPNRQTGQQCFAVFAGKQQRTLQHRRSTTAPYSVRAKTH